MPTLEKLQRETPGNPNFDTALSRTVFSGQQFDWQDNRGRTFTGRLGVKEFPKDFSIRSHRTGETVDFILDSEVNEANEFFDGEAMAYYAPCTDHETKVQIWCGDSI